MKKNLPKIGMAALKGVSNALTTIPGIRTISAAIGATRAAQSLKSDLYSWADKITTGFEPSTAMKLQMEQNYTAYLQNNSSYRSSKDYQNAFRNKTLRDDLEIIEAQISAVLSVFGEAEIAIKIPTKSSNKFMASKSGNFGSNTVGAAEKYIPQNIKKVSDQYLKKKNMDAHEIKESIVGKNGISKYDLYVDKDTGMLWIYRKGGRGEPEPTYEMIK